MFLQTLSVTDLLQNCTWSTLKRANQGRGCMIWYHTHTCTPTPMQHAHLHKCMHTHACTYASHTHTHIHTHTISLLNMACQTLNIKIVQWCLHGLTFTLWGRCGLCFDINQPSMPTHFYSVFLCLFLSLWPFQLYFIPWIFPTTLHFLALFFRFYFCLIHPFNYTSLWKVSFNPDIILCGWLG